MAFPTIEDVTAVSNISGSTITGTEPTSMAVDDILLAVIIENDTTGGTLATPTGWTKVGQYGDASSDVIIGIYYHVWAGSAPTYVFTKVSSSDHSVLWLYRIDGGRTGDPVPDIDGARTTSDQTSVVKSMTTSIDNSLVISIVGFDGDGTGFTVSGTGWAEGADENDKRSDIGAGVSGSWGYLTKGGAGSTSSVTFSSASSNGWAIALVALPAEQERRVFNIS